MKLTDEHKLEIAKNFIEGGSLYQRYAFDTVSIRRQSICLSPGPVGMDMNHCPRDIRNIHTQGNASLRSFGMHHCRAMTR